MAEKHPYIGGPGGIIQVLDHLKKSFPATMNAEVLKKLGFAPKNESYVLNILRFLKLIDDKGTRSAAAQKTFSLHEVAAFQKAFSDIVKSAYADLFSLHSDAAWTLDTSKLITFFRQTDQSTALVGARQASTFKTLAAYGGHGEPVAAPKPRAAAAKGEKKAATTARARTPAPVAPPKPAPKEDGRDLGLTVRIEINLPAQGDKETYDNIFKSIRENLLNG